MKLRSNNWLNEWKNFAKEPAREPQPKTSRMQRLREATEGFMDNVETWIDTVTGNGDVPLEEVLPWNDLFDGKMRTVIPAQNEDDRNIQRLAYILWNENYQLPVKGRSPSGTVPYHGFPVERVIQKKRRAGGEVYEVEAEVAKLSLEKTTSKTIPKGPRKGEKIEKTRTSSISKIVNHLADRHAEGVENPSLASVNRSRPGVPADLKKWWDKNQTFYTQAGNWKALETLIKDPANADVLDKQSIIISRDPRDVIRMGDMELERSMGKIGHCHEEGGAYANCAIAEAKGTSPIAYLVSTRDLNYFLGGKDNKEREKHFMSSPGDTSQEPPAKYNISEFDGQEIFSDAQRDIKGLKVINRLRLRQFLDERTGDQWAIPSLKIYPSGMKVLGWDKALQKWAWDNQKEMLEDNYEEGEFPDLGDWRRFGGWYTDPGDNDGTVLNRFFTQSGSDPDYRDRNVENTTEEDQGPSVIEQWEEQMEETLETYNSRWEHSSIWGEVDEDEGDPQHPMMWFTGQFQVQFDGDLFGDDAGAEYEVESLDDWRTLQGFEKDLKNEMDARSMYKYFEEINFDQDNRGISLRFDIARDDYEANPAGLDSFAEYVESDWDNDYDEIRAVVRRTLINEGYMAPLPIDKLAAAEPDDFKFWDIDVDDGGSVSIRLDTPEMAAGGAPYKYRPGIFVGELPAGMQLDKIFTDWRHAGHSEEFASAFVPKIRALFAEAEKYVQQQLDLPGMEQEDDVLGLLIPSRAIWRLDQGFKEDWSAARIFLQVQLDVGEDVDEAGMEEIEHFIKYLDRQEALEIIRDAAVETIKEAIEPAKTRVQHEKKIVAMREELQVKLMSIPLKELLSLAKNMKGPSNMLADANGALYTISYISRKSDSTDPLLQLGQRSLPEGISGDTTTAEQVQEWVAALDEILDKLNRGEITQVSTPPGSRINVGDYYYADAFQVRSHQAAQQAGSDEPLDRKEAEVQLPYFFLPQSLRGDLRSLWGGLKDLIPNMVNKMQDMAMTYSGDPYQRVSYYTKPDNQEMSGADWLPKWWVPLMYKYEFLDPEMSFDEEVVAVLKQTQAKRAQEAEPQKKLELKESRKRRKIRIRIKKRR